MTAELVSANPAAHAGFFARDINAQIVAVQEHYRNCYPADVSSVIYLGSHIRVELHLPEDDVYDARVVQASNTEIARLMGQGTTAL